MKTIKLTTLLLALALVFGSTSCKKYEDGPGLSLRTKTARVAGDWEVEKYISADGTEDTDSDNTTYSFDKDGSGTISASESGNSFSIPFTWEFTSNKEKIKLTTNFMGTTETDEATILRLTNKEMWIKDSDGDQTNFKAK